MPIALFASFSLASANSLQLLASEKLASSEERENPSLASAPPLAAASSRALFQSCSRSLALGPPSCRAQLALARALLDNHALRARARSRSPTRRHRTTRARARPHLPSQIARSRSRMAAMPGVPPGLPLAWAALGAPHFLARARSRSWGHAATARSRSLTPLWCERALLAGLATTRSRSPSLAHLSRRRELALARAHVAGRLPPALAR